MKAVVVYQSIWGNTAAVARAIAQGIGNEASALSTAEASPAELEGADLIVVGSPIIAFGAPSDSMMKSIADGQSREKVAPDLSQPPISSWLKTLPKGSGRSAAFETGLSWSPGGAKGTIGKALEAAGYMAIAKARRFVVKGKYGPLRDGELESARLWGEELARAMG